MKGSKRYNEYDSDTYYSLPRYEPNFVYLFGVEEMFVDGCIELDTGKSFLIIKNKKDDYYNKKLTLKEINDIYGIDLIFEK